MSAGIPDGLTPRSRICQEFAHSLVLPNQIGNEVPVSLPVTFHFDYLVLK